MDPKNVEALYYSGLVLMAQQKTEQAVEALEKARALAPRDQSILFLLGVAYFALERYDQAEGPLTQVFIERPQTEGIGYYVGLIRYRKKDYQGALKAFRAETSKNPNIQQLVKFYSGLTLAILGLPEQAVAEVDAALRLQTGSALTGPAERIRDSLVAAKDAERRLRGEVRVGFLYDSNVRVEPQPSHDPTAESLRHQKTATSGEIFAARLEYAWLRTGPWESTVAYSFFQTVNNRDAAVGLQCAEPSGVGGPVLQGGPRRNAVPGGHPVLLGLHLPRRGRLPAAADGHPLRHPGGEPGKSDHAPGAVPVQGLPLDSAAAPRRGSRRAELDGGVHPRLPLRPGPALCPGGLPVRLRGLGRTELHLCGQSHPDRRAVHAAVGVHAAQVRLRSAPAGLLATRTRSCPRSIRTRDSGRTSSRTISSASSRSSPRTSGRARSGARRPHPVR